METEGLQKRLEELRSLVDLSKRLKEVFDSNWFEGARESIAQADESVTMKTHTAFIGYLQDALLEPDRPNLLRDVDDAMDQISAAARRALRDKLRMVAGPVDDYVSTVFELLMVQRFVGHGLLLEYEPVIASGQPEGKVRLADQEVIVEARATLDSAFKREDGWYDPGSLGRKLAGKMREKYQRQLSGASLPVILFLALNQNLRFDDREVSIALDTIVGDDPASTVLSAVVLSDDFRARDFRSWMHPRARRALSDAAQQELHRVLDK